LRDGHKTSTRAAILLGGSVLAAPAALAAQARDPVLAVTVRDAVAFGVASARLATAPPGLVQVACDPARVPAFDRWVIGPPRPAWQVVGDLGLIGVAGVTTADLLRRGDEARAVTALGAGLATFGVTQVIKVVVGRPRPDRYAPDPTPARPCRGDSFPSGHASVAMAFATTYWLARHDLDGAPGAPGWLALAGAAGVGVSRLAARRHFPSDVLAGLVLGAAGGTAVYRIRF
jgi:membrane-associated phospholipid phosphatase